jgi:hypothetical protein
MQFLYCLVQLFGSALGGKYLCAFMPPRCPNPVVDDANKKPASDFNNMAFNNHPVINPALFARQIKVAAKI